MISTAQTSEARLGQDALKIAFHDLASLFSVWASVELDATPVQDENKARLLRTGDYVCAIYISVAGVLTRFRRVMRGAN